MNSKKKINASKIAVFAGSFDPFTEGHLDIAKRAAAMFDELWILVAVNASKSCLFSLKNRIDFIRKSCKNLRNVKVAEFSGLTVEFMQKVGARYLVRGVRNGSDMDYELSVGWNNKTLYPECESVYLASAPEHLAVSSTVVRELLKCGIAKTAAGRKKLAKYVPAEILPMVVEFGGPK
ncbi:MAG: pantetheine-phosphate adenylyltransferase [Fibrobacter sp.]|nr:pantetheine-phosphate adenylyltransferase [Fibrobacter sp.]